MPLDATVGGADANTYILEPAATALVPGLVSPAVLAAWVAAGTVVLENGLAKSALMLDSFETRYIGLRTRPEFQALAWPRQGALTIYDRLYSENVIPLSLKQAQVLYAALDIAGEIDITGIDDVGGIVSEQAGPVSASYAPQNRARGAARAPGVLILLQSLFRVPAAGAVRL